MRSVARVLCASLIPSMLFGWAYACNSSGGGGGNNVKADGGDGGMLSCTAVCAAKAKSCGVPTAQTASDCAMLCASMPSQSELACAKKASCTALAKSFASGASFCPKEGGGLGMAPPDASSDGTVDGKPGDGGPGPKDGEMDARRDAATDATMDSTTGPAGDAASDAGMKGCTYTVSGGASGSGTCTAIAAFGQGALSFTLTGLGSATPLTFGATLGSAPPLVTGTFTQASTSFSAGEYEVVADDMSMPPMGSWALCYRPGNPCAGWAPSGDPPVTFNDVGSFTLTIDKTGPGLGPGGDGGAQLWAGACGTLSASFPAQQGTTSPGTVDVEAKFCGVAPPDASAPDSGDDAPHAHGACGITLSGGTTGMTGCTATATYISVLSETDFAISGASDGGPHTTVNLLFPGYFSSLAGGTLTAETLNVLCGPGSHCAAVTSVSTGNEAGTEAWSRSLSPDAGFPPWFDLQMISNGTINPVNETYQSETGNYTATLPPNVDGGQPVTVKVAF